MGTYPTLEHNKMNADGVESWPLDPEVSDLIIMPPHLPLHLCSRSYFIQLRGGNRFEVFLLNQIKNYLRVVI